MIDLVGGVLLRNAEHVVLLEENPHHLLHNLLSPLLHLDHALVTLREVVELLIREKEARIVEYVFNGFSQLHIQAFDLLRQIDTDTRSPRVFLV